MNEILKQCDNPECKRRTKFGILFCCSPCSAAYYGKYEIHEAGPLAHSEGCNRRHADRSHDIYHGDSK